jgi:hypothetical protein
MVVSCASVSRKPAVFVTKYFEYQHILTLTLKNLNYRDTEFLIFGVFFIDKSKIIYTIVIPDKGGCADRRSGIQCMSAAELHKILDPVCASVLRTRQRDDE